MSQIIVINYSRPQELALVQGHVERFGADVVRVVTNMETDFQNVWKFPTMDKKNVEWTKRFLEKFLAEDADTMIKIDPDTVIKILPSMPVRAEAAGDFRKSNVGWIWFGACQYYRRTAVTKILADAKYTGMCMYQDMALASSVARCGLRAYNMPEINGWSRGDEDALVVHRGLSDIDRLPGGWCTLK
jgi:hypothetical protein